MELSIGADGEQSVEYEDVRQWFGMNMNEPFGYVSADLPSKATIRFSLVLSADFSQVLSSEINTVATEFVEISLNPHPAKDAR